MPVATTIWFTREALVIGLASGVTVGALAEHKLDYIKIVEIEPAMIGASRTFDAISGAPLDDPRVEITIDDGRQFLRSTQKRFDVIISEPSNPWLSISARLFTKEFFTLAHERLTSDGVMVQWLPLYGLSKNQFEALLRTMLEVFPEMSLFQVAEGDLVAIAGNTQMAIDSNQLAQLFTGDRADKLHKAGIISPTDLLSRWVADSDGLRAILETGPMNTDDNGLLEFGSPWYILTDTRMSNLSLIERAWSQSKIPKRIVTMADSRNGYEVDFELLTKQYLSRNRPDMLISLSDALRSVNKNKMADLLAGDAVNFQGRWKEAQNFWELHNTPPFLLRRAKLAYKLGDLQKAERLFARVSQSEITDEDSLLNALALIGAEREQDALDILGAISPNLNTPSGIIAPFIMSILLQRSGLQKEALRQRNRFEKSLDGIRRCLEIDGCSNVAQAVTQWGNTVPPGMQSRDWDLFMQSMFVRVMRPLPHYFEGVRNLWLGDQNQAMESFQTYLALLPTPDPQSKAQGFIDNPDSAVGSNH